MQVKKSEGYLSDDSLPLNVFCTEEMKLLMRLLRAEAQRLTDASSNEFP